MDKEFIENPVEAYEKLKQECEFSNLRIIQLQETLSQYETDLSTKDCIIETCKAQYKELKAENEELKKQLTILDDEDVVVEITVKQFEEYKKLKAILTEIKSILELYANSKVGEEQPDGTYQLSSGIGGSFGFGFGVCTTTYDPRPARQALQKISEVEE